MGVALQATALLKQAFDLTGHERDIGLIGLAEFLPAMLLVLVTGSVADRLPKKGIAMPTPASSTETDTIQTLDIRKEVLIAASPEIAFAALLEELGPGSVMPDGTPFPMKIEPWFSRPARTPGSRSPIGSP